MRHGEGDATRSRIVKKKAGEEGGSRWAIIQEKEGRGGVQRVTHCPKEGPGCGLSLLEQRVGRPLPGPTRYILPCPLQRFFFLSLSRSLPNANIVSENCTKARHVWSVNFCHHKSISHARGGGSFRRRGGQGAVHLETVTSNERNENPEILNICTQTYVSFDITLFANSDAFFSFLSLFEATKGTESLEPERPRSLLHQTRCHDFRGPIRGDFVVFLHQSFRLIGPRNLPPRQRELPKSSYSFPESGHQKEKRAHKRSSSLPLLDSVLRAEDRRDRQREEEGFLHLWRRRAPVVESLLILTRIARINPFLRRLKLGEGRGEEVTRMVKLYRSRCSISRPTVVPFSLSLYKFSNINHDFFFSSSPPLSSLLQQRSLPDRLLAGHCSKNYLRPLEKWKKERWKSRSSKISREISCISFLEEGIDSYRFYKFYERKGERERQSVFVYNINENRVESRVKNTFRGKRC